MVDFVEGQVAEVEARCQEFFAEANESGAESIVDEQV